MATVVNRKSNGKSPDYVVTAKDPHSDNFYFTIGAAWKGETKEGAECIFVRMKAAPLDGKITLFVPKPDGSPPTDDVPF
jgi:uncharacterized protein (DUF736 family)